jgi:hypothetical protein
MTADLRAVLQVLAAQITPTPAKPTGLWRSCLAWLSLLELNKCQELIPDPFDFSWLAKYVNARGPFAEIVEAVYDCRSSRLSSGFGFKNNSHSSKANEDVGAPAEIGFHSSNGPNVKN